MGKKKAKKWVKVVGYNILVVLLFFVAVEGILTYLLNHPGKCPRWLLPTLRSYYHQYDQSIIQYNPKFAHYDSTLFYALNPGSFVYANREFSNQYSVNSKGFRDDEASLEYPEMVVIGDSYTMGWGVNQDETYADLLEKELGIRVLNTGVSSYGTAREVESLKKVNMDSTKYLVIQYCPNDLSENQNFVQQKNQLKVSSHELWKKGSDAHLKRTRYYPFKHTIRITGLLRKSKQKKQPEKKVAPPKDEPVVGSIEAFLAVLKENHHIPEHAHIIVFSLEAVYCHGFFVNELKKQVDKQFASSLHDRMSYIDLTGQLDSTHRYILDPHLKSNGHRVIANNIKKHIQTLPIGYEYRFWLYPERTDTAITCEYMNGLKHGQFKAFWETGEVSMTSFYRNGSKHGIETSYSRDGKITDQRYFEEGIEVPQP